MLPLMSGNTVEIKYCQERETEIFSARDTVISPKSNHHNISAFQNVSRFGLKIKISFKDSKVPLVT